MRVNILGCGAREWEKAPFGEKDVGQFWGVNDMVLVAKLDVVVDVHNIKNVMKGKEKIRRSPEVVKACLKKIKKTGVLCYSTKEVKDVPNIKKYPYDEIVKEFDSDYFGSGPDYALALAIYKGATEIHTYGILMVVGDEYFYQKPSFEHWLGVAKGRGIKTVIHDQNNVSSILKLRHGMVYGYNKPQRWKQRVMDNPKEFIGSYS